MSLKNTDYPNPAFSQVYSYRDNPPPNYPSKWRPPPDQIYLDLSNIDIKYCGKANSPIVNGSHIFEISYPDHNLQREVIARYTALNKKTFVSVNSVYQKYTINSDQRYEIIDLIKAFIAKHGGLEKLSVTPRSYIKKLEDIKKLESVQEDKVDMKDKIYMNNKTPTFVENKLSTMKSEALEATKRESVNAAWDVLKNGIVKIGLDGLSEERSSQAKELLNTAMGDMFLRILVGVALEQVSGKLSSDVRMAALTKELRIQGYQSVLGSYLQPMTTLVNEALKEMNPFAAALEDK